MPRGLSVRAALGGAIAVGAFALTGCSLMPARDGAAFPLLPPASLGVAIERQQLLRLASGPTTHSFQCVVRVTPAAIVVVALGPMGQRAFTLTYDAAGLRVESAAEAHGAPEPARILADLQMALWPAAALAAATAGTTWEVLEPEPGFRRVLRAGRPYAEIRHLSAQRWDGKLWLVNFVHDYSLAIDSRALGG